MRNKLLLGAILCFLMLGKAFAQGPTIGLAGEVTQPGAQVRAYWNFNQNFRLGLEYTDYFNRLIGWSCTDAVWLYQNYSTINFSAGVPVRERWGIYARGGLGMEYYNVYSQSTKDDFTPTSGFDFGLHIGAGAEFKMDRFKIFGEALFRHNTFTDFDSEGNILFGISYDLFSQP